MIKKIINYFIKPKCPCRYDCLNCIHRDVVYETENIIVIGCKINSL